MKSNTSAAESAAAPVSRSKTRTVVVASAAGTVFEWYDFFIFGSLTPIISKHFYAAAGESTGFILALLTFAAGFAVRPLGALVFGRFGDRTGRKSAFLITITLMGLATFAIGFLPTYESVGVLAPILLVTLRCAQGFALGGEYGGAAIYVAEHAAPGKRGALTGWIQTSASIGLLGALGVILATRTLLGEDAFQAWGWRIPFWISIGLLAVSLWIRLGLQESPAFQRMKAEGRQSRAPLAESFTRWPNLKLVLIALFSIMMAQGVVWYTGHFYAQFFLERMLKVAPSTVNMLMISVTAVSALMYIFFAWLSDKIGRKPVMLFGIALAAISFFPGFQIMTRAANPALADAMVSSPVVVQADPNDCSVQFDPVGKKLFASSCDIAKSVLTNAGVSYSTTTSPTGVALVHVGETLVVSFDGQGLDRATLAAQRKEFEGRVKAALNAAGYPDKANPEQIDVLTVFGILMVFIIAATALYGPQAAALVELFPTRIRYSALSLPYHIGTGWFGGFLPATAFAIVSATGNVYSGLWYPVICAALSFVITLFFLPETYRRDIDA